MTHSPPMDGGVGKCGQNAGDVMEREIFRSSRGRLTARERFGAPPLERDDEENLNTQVEKLPLT